MENISLSNLMSPLIMKASETYGANKRKSSPRRQYKPHKHTAHQIQNAYTRDTPDHLANIIDICA